MGGQTIYNAVCRRTRKALGFAVNLQRFRIAAATFWSIRDPANVRGVKDLLGHTDIRTTQRYAHLAKRGGVFERAISALAKAPVGVPSAPREAATGTHGTHGTEPFHK